ncbi:MAG: DNA-binding protein [Methylococcales bacterium]
MVQQARDALVKRGDNPSIDAVRVELGNTGSKTTIHRYLKEIDEELSSKLDDKELLSDPIHALVGRLASRLQEDAKGLIKKAEDQHNQCMEDLELRFKNKSEELIAAEKQIEKLNTSLKTSQESIENLDAKVLALTLDTQRYEQKVTDFDLINNEKDKQIISLEDKHTHNREALEHYRKSTKEQREQDNRNQERQVQLLQTEIRELKQTAMIKQTDLTQLNKDNSRLATELVTTQKSLLSTESALTTSAFQKNSLMEEVRNLSLKLETSKKNETTSMADLNTFKSEHKVLTSDTQALKIDFAKLESELVVKTKLIERLVPEKGANPNAT